MKLNPKPMRKAKLKWRVVSKVLVVRSKVLVVRKCGHETEHELGISLGALKQLCGTECQSCSDLTDLKIAFQKAAVELGWGHG